MSADIGEVFRLILTLAFIAIVGLILFDANHHAPATPVAPPPAPVATAPGASKPVAVPAGPTPVPTALPVPSGTPTLDMMARLAVRRRLAREGDRVYLDSLLAATDSTLVRWIDRRTLNVAFVRDSTLPGWTPALLDDARAGMLAWRDNPVGIALQPTDDSVADIVVRWVSRLPDTPQAGLTHVDWNPADGVISHVTITLAMQQRAGTPLPPDARVRIAAHEFGHAFGLPNSDSPDDMMFRTSPTDLPSSRDQATLRLLYAVPPGPLKIVTPP